MLDIIMQLDISVRRIPNNNNHLSNYLLSHEKSTIKRKKNTKKLWEN